MIDLLQCLRAAAIGQTSASRGTVEVDVCCVSAMKVAAGDVRLWHALLMLTRAALESHRDGQIVLGAQALAGHGEGSQVEFSVTLVQAPPPAGSSTHSTGPKGHAVTGGGAAGWHRIAAEAIGALGARLEVDRQDGVDRRIRLTLRLAKPLDGVRLLLVDQDLAHQQRARSLLHDAGAWVVSADNLRQALLATRSAMPAFDLLLLDTRWPEASLGQVMQALRRSGVSHSTPLVGMVELGTGGSPPADWADLSAKVAKPLSMETLDNLALVLERQKAYLQASGAGRWIAHIDRSGAIARLGGRPDVWVRLARRFSAGLAASLSQIVDAQRSGQGEELARLLHRLKGDSAAIGAATLAACVAAAEHELATGGVRDIDLLASAVELTQAQLLMLSDPGPAPPASGTIPPQRAGADELRAAIRQLIPMLERREIASTDVLAGLVESLGSDWAEDLHALNESLAGLDFDQALADCLALRRKVDA